MEFLDVADGLGRVERGDDLLEGCRGLVAPAAAAEEPREPDGRRQYGRGFGGLAGRLERELEVAACSGQVAAGLEDGRANGERQVLLAVEAGRPDQRVRLLERFLPIACVEPKAEDVAPEERRRA